MKIFVYLFFALTLPLTISGQYSLRGVVSDSTGMPLIAATTVIVNPIDSTMVTFGITNSIGKFFLKNVPKGNHLLQITYIGYGTFQQEIIANGENAIIDLEQIVLSPDNELLEEIVVKAEYVPLVIKGDTLEYNADAFKTRKTDAVEDLLKKLPGVEVEQDGNIKVQGEDVDQVLVDGKEFFGDDHRMATKNLPAEVVDKVAVFDKKSKETEFTGIDDGTRNKTIDLKLKEDKKAGAFGKIEAGIGSNSRYSGKFNLNRFSSKTQTSLISNLNNVNNVGFSMNSGMDLGERIIQIGGGSLFGLNGRGNNPGDNTTGNAGINLNHDFSKKLKWRSSYNFNYADQFVEETNRSQYFLNDLNYINQQENKTNFDQRGHNLHSAIEFDIDSLTEFRMSSKLNLKNSKNNINSIGSNISENEEVLSSIERLDFNRADAINLQLEGVLRRRLGRKGRILQLKGGWNTKNDDDERNLDNIILDLNERIEQIQNQIEDENTHSLNGTISFTEPVSNHWLWTVSFSSAMNNHNQSNDFFQIDPISGNTSPIGSLSNIYQKGYNFRTLGSSFRYLNENINLSTGFSYFRSQLTGSIEENIINDNSFDFILPRFDLAYELDNGRIGLNYRTSIREPSLYQLQPVINNRNPLFLYQGNPNLKPSYNHNLTLNFNKFDNFNFRSWFGFVMLNYGRDYISNARTIDENLVTRTTPVNIDDNLNINSNISYSSPIAFMKMRISARSNYTFTTALVDNIDNDNKRLGAGMSMTLENKKKDYVDIRLTGGFDVVNSRFSVQENFNQQYVTSNIGGSVEVYFSDRTIFDTDFRLENYSQEQFSTDDQLYFWNVGLSQTIGENERFTLSLEGKDLFNTNAGIDRNAYAGVLSEVQSSSLGRYFLFKLSYSLSAFTPKSMFSLH